MPVTRSARKPAARRSGAGLGFLQVSPTALLMLAFLLVPLAVMVGMSFFRSTIFGMQTTPSFANYTKLFTEPIYGRLLLKSLRMAHLRNSATRMARDPETDLSTRRFRPRWKIIKVRKRRNVDRWAMR